MICQAMEGHVRRALSSGWSLPSLKDLQQPDMSMQVNGGGGGGHVGAGVVEVVSCYYFHGILPSDHLQLHDTGGCCSW